MNTVLSRSTAADTRLAGKVALITGGTSGIGRATVELFVAEGARVLVVARGAEAGEALAKGLGERVLFQQGDVGEEAQVAAAVARAVEAWGRLDCVFNNAGSLVQKRAIEATPVEAFDAAVATLLRGVFLGIKHAVPAMKAQGGGSIINCASVAARRAGAAPLLYSAAKAAVVQLTRSAAAELAPFGIRVNSISPGGIATPVFARALGLSAAEMSGERAAALAAKRLRTAQPLQRAGMPEDVAHAALFLASDEASFITGHDLVVDGGYSVVSPGLDGTGRLLILAGRGFGIERGSAGSMAPQHIAVIALATAVYGSFAWGFFGHFRRPQGVPPLLQLTGAAATALTVAQIARLWRHDPGLWSAPAILGYAAAAGLFAWAVAATRTQRPNLAFSADAPIRLVAEGPYRYVRHPFYAAYLLYWLAGAVALRELWQAPAIAAVAALYVLAALQEERRFADSTMTRAYGEYRRSTGMFLPRLKGFR